MSPSPICSTSAATSGQPVGRGAHDRRRRRHDRPRRRRRPAACRAAGCGRASRPRLLRPGRHRADDHRCAARARPAQAGPYAGGAVTHRRRRARTRRSSARSRGRSGSTSSTRPSGMIRLMEQKLLHAVQRISTERGHDPRRFTLVAAGGAGPLHGAAVGRALGCRRVYVPRLSGAFCALGMLHADMRHDYVRMHIGPAGRRGPRRGCDAIFGALEAGGERDLCRARASPGRRRASSTRSTCATSASNGTSRCAIDDGVSTRRTRSASAPFETEHDRLFGHIQPGRHHRDHQAARDRHRNAAAAVVAEPATRQAATPRADRAAQGLDRSRRTGWWTTPVYRWRCACARASRRRTCDRQRADDDRLGRRRRSPRRRRGRQLHDQLRTADARGATEARSSHDRHGSTRSRSRWCRTGSTTSPGRWAG